MDVLRSPTILKTPIGELHRQWAVLDGYKSHRNPDGSTTCSPVWAELPTPLNDTMNQKLDQLTESLSAYSTLEESDELEYFSFKIDMVVDLHFKSTWLSEHFNYAPFQVDMVVDLQNMTQRNMQAGTERAVAFWYK